MIEVKSIIILLIIMIGVKKILENWKPPFQASIQAIIMIVVGGLFGWFLDPTKDGLITGLIGGTMSFWGRSIFAEIQELKDGTQEFKHNNKGDK